MGMDIGPVPGGTEIAGIVCMPWAQDPASHAIAGFEHGKGFFLLRQQSGGVNTAQPCSDDDGFDAFGCRWIHFNPFRIRLFAPGGKGTVSPRATLLQ